MRKPFPHRAESIRDEVVAPFATMPLLSHEAGIEQDAQMLRDRRATHLEVACYRVDCTVFNCKQVKHLSPCRMADRGEDIRTTLESCYHVASIGK